ncbi:MAG: hypothetical protein LBO74_14565 [Candidatus Symbiothrix sp.]|nr:hypothetical protein [Candidatus Symbiothrix sp.]
MLKYSVVKTIPKDLGGPTKMNVTLEALNNYPDQSALFDRIKAERIAYIERICLSRPANQRFKKGWLNRLADFRFSPTMVCILALMFCLSSCKSIPSETMTVRGNKSNRTNDRRICFISKMLAFVKNFAPFEIRF